MKLSKKCFISSFLNELAHLDGQLYTDLADRIYTNEELDAMLEEQVRIEAAVRDKRTS